MARFTQLEQWLTWMEQLHPSEIDLGLSRVATVAKNLNIPRRLPATTRVITVAGTNGKGSCVTTLQHLCLANGQTVGSFTSPHLLRYNERIQINGIELCDERICDAFSRIDVARGDISLTYFEFGTLAALLLFHDQPLDYWLLEVGLGGRLDAVNIIDADVAVITSIDLDHEAWLGSTREVIAVEKAGIIKSHSIVVCAENNPPKSLLSILKQHTESTYLIDQDFSYSHEGDNLTVVLDEHHRIAVVAPNLPFPSFSAAFKVFSLLNGVECLSVLGPRLAGITLKGRLERYRSNDIDVLLDVAHNPAATKHLVQRLKLKDSKRYVVVMAIMADKAITETISPLCEITDHWVCSEITGLSRCEKAFELGNKVSSLSSAPVEVVLDMNDALSRAIDIARENECGILVVGSFFTVSAAQSYFQSRSV